MDNSDKKPESLERDINYFEKMIEGSDKILEKATKSWKYAVIGLVVAVVLSNLIWGIVHGYTIYKAYQQPQEIEAMQFQELPNQQQEQSIKGAS